MKSSVSNSFFVLYEYIYYTKVTPNYYQYLVLTIFTPNFSTY